MRCAKAILLVFIIILFTGCVSVVNDTDTNEELKIVSVYHEKNYLYFAYLQNGSDVIYGVDIDIKNYKHLYYSNETRLIKLASTNRTFLGESFDVYWDGN